MTKPLITIDDPALRLGRVCGDGELSDVQRRELWQRMLDWSSRVTLCAVSPIIGKPLTDTAELP